MRSRLFFAPQETQNQEYQNNHNHNDNRSNNNNNNIPINGDSAKSNAPAAATITKATATATLSPLTTFFTKIGLMAFITGMCIVLPLTLFPQRLLLSTGILTKIQSEKLALSTGEFCADLLFRLIPFCNIEITSTRREDGKKENEDHTQEEPEPAIWVCNHTSMLDFFVLMAAERRMDTTNSRKRRPIKIIYWKQLEVNPVSKLLFRQCGFIPVQMTANAAGENNEYDRSSFRKMLQETKRALSEGFDIGILPEGQLNPNPEEGLLPVFSGAYTVAKLSRRPIYMMALHGVNKLWHPIDGMEPTDRRVKVRSYPIGRFFDSGNDFVDSFTNVVGHFGQYGEDTEDWESWLDGTAAAASSKGDKMAQKSPKNIKQSNDDDAAQQNGET
eukprot:CAMPEP_0202449042 /NCGR_PEP_ID=MMETSP1360-20130828/7819_1 /ASSEMBLY_ACC=CAM_ASM_000848 /TAXON_ID=515479 /ORGANISM="Licmophora paradoxa, Strain CCMP2313" /LENGTH=386 /DNA_ID=CAMNT_0049066851 /DNA_START=132 /DNA_END=1292 /DNA_ORIENTATION=+